MPRPTRSFRRGVSGLGPSPLLTPPVSGPQLAAPSGLPRDLLHHLRARGLAAAQATPERKLELSEELDRMRAGQVTEAERDYPAPPEPEGLPSPAPAAISPRLGTLGPGPSQRRPMGEARGGPPLQDFESIFRDEDRTSKIDALKRQRDISEGLKEAGTGFARLSGVQMPDVDPTDYGIREDLADAKDEVSFAERQALQAQGLNIPAGIKRSMLVQMLPAISGIQRQKSQQEFQGGEAERQREFRSGEAGKQREHELGMAGVRERRAGVAATAKAQAAAKLSDKELSEVGQMDDAIQGMEGILKKREEKGYSTGILDKMAVKVGEMTGVGLSEENLQWRGKVRLQLATWIRDMAGAALGPKEAELYLDAMPTEWDNEPAFDAKLTSVIDGLKKKRQGFLKTRRWAGKETGPFEKVRFEVPGRGTASVSGGEADEFERDWPDAVRQSGG